MLKNLLNTKNKRVLIYFILITLVFFGAFIKTEFALDSFCILQFPDKAIYDSFSQGRFLKGIFYILILKPEFRFGYKYIASYILALVSLVLAQYKLYMIINKNIKNDLISMLIATMIIINPFSIELMMFYEKGIMCLGILFAIYAFDTFSKRMVENSIKSFIIPCIFMALSDFSYQGIASIFILLCSIYICKNSKNIKDFIINNIKMGLVYFIPAVINVLIVRFIFVNNRVTGNISIVDTVSTIFKQLPVMFKFYDILPYSILLIGIYFIIYIISTLIKENGAKSKIINIFLYLYIFIAVFMSTIAPQLLQNTNSVWLVPRSTYAFGSILGLTALLVMLENNNKYLKRVVICVSITTLFMQFYSFAKIEIDHYTLNYLDRVNSYKIGDKIKNYENTTGKKVKYITYSEDQNKTYTYLDIKARQDMNISGFSSYWSYKDMINYYTGLNLKEKEATDEEKTRCLKDDTTDFDIDKITIKNNTISFCGF